jgi:hypothetical protein
VNRTEIHARATIAAALIVSRAVAPPTLPTTGTTIPTAADRQLIDLTDHVYRLISTSRGVDRPAVGRRAGRRAAPP